LYFAANIYNSHLTNPQKSCIFNICSDVKKQGRTNVSPACFKFINVKKGKRTVLWLKDYTNPNIPQAEEAAED
jgi:hypothetical protein